MAPGYRELNGQLQTSLEDFSKPQAWLSGTILDAAIFLLRRDYSQNVSIVSLVDMEGILNGEAPRTALSTDKPSLLFLCYGSHWRLLISFCDSNEMALLDSNAGTVDSWTQELWVTKLKEAIPGTYIRRIETPYQTDGISPSLLHSVFLWLVCSLLG